MTSLYEKKIPPLIILFVYMFDYFGIIIVTFIIHMESESRQRINRTHRLQDSHT